jgi:hypothetical protein
MNDFELNKMLKAAPPPPLGADYLKDFPRSVLARMRSTLPRSHRAKYHWMPRLVWGGGAIFASLAIGFILGNWRAQIGKEAMASVDPLVNAQVVRETLKMFPNQVRAIIEDKHGLQLVISEKPDVPASPPLYVRICSGKQCAAVVTFSGQEIQIAGQTLTVLSDAQGGIILVGDDFAWSSRKPTSAKNNLRIEAAHLDAAAM